MNATEPQTASPAVTLDNEQTVVERRFTVTDAAPVARRYVHPNKTPLRMIPDTALIKWVDGRVYRVELTGGQILVDGTVSARKRFTVGYHGWLYSDADDLPPWVVPLLELDQPARAGRTGDVDA